MNKETLFNKEEFAALLDKAKGDRSINQYANETGVSAAHISRFLRQMIDAPPTPETISKLSSKSYNEVSYRDLMVAAGHISISDGDSLDGYDEANKLDSDNMEYLQALARVSRISPRERQNWHEDLKKKFFQTILSYLYEVPFTWSIQKPEGRFARPDMIIDVEHEGYKKWLIEFKPTLDERRFSGLNLFHTYGHLATMELTETDKISIAVNSEQHYAHFFRRPPISLRANVYIMLVDLDYGKILREEKLCDYYYG